MSDKKLEDTVPDVPRHVLRDGNKIPQLGLGTTPWTMPKLRR